MRKIQEVLRLHFLGQQKQRAISRAVQCSRPAVAEYIRRAENAGLVCWEDVRTLNETQLERLLFPQAEDRRAGRKPIPDWNKVHAELRRPGVTRELLWQEYRQEFPHGYGRSMFNALYRDWEKKLSPVMRQTHRAGEKMFVDYCDGLFLTNPETGERKQTQLFVSVLGASSYTFAEATLSQTLPEWLDSHVHSFEFFGGVPEITVPDNLRSGVSKACRYEPEINPSYRDLAVHYETCIIPARRKKPRDKAKVEAAVLVAERWILAVLRNHTFHTLAEMNRAIRELLERINNRTMRHVGKSRRELYRTIDRPALKPLPLIRYEFTEIKKAKVNIDYHVVFDGHFYSVPYTLIHAAVELRVNTRTVEILHKGRRIDSHVRSRVRGGFTTKKEHMPPSHRAHSEWTPSRIVAWAQTVGDSTAALVQAMIDSRKHPEQAYRAALGIIRLAKKYGKERVEQAAARAIAIDSPRYRTVDTMLKNKIESVPLPETPIARPEQPLLFSAENLRGKTYYR